MNTRFDNPEIWVTGDGRILELVDMETSHLMNTVRMFIRNPWAVASMLIKDFESCADSCSSQAWSMNKKSGRNLTKESISAVTSLATKQLTEYALGSPLGQAMLEELQHRGVNVANLIQIWSEEVNSDPYF